MNEKKLKEYANLQVQIKELEAKRDALKTIVVDEMEKTGERKIEKEFGKFTLSARTTYMYSNRISDMLDEVKIAKAEEEEKGIAVPSSTPVLTFTAPKA